MADATTAQAVGGAIESVAGVIQTMEAAKQQMDAMQRMSRAAEKEMQAISIQGEETAKAAIERAYAALRDSRFLSEMTTANIRFLREQSDDAIGTTVAQAAGSGLDFIGSPVLVAAEISLNVNRAIQNQKMTEELGTYQFEFEVDKEMRAVGLARQGAQIAMDATAVSRQAQIGAASFDAFRSITTAGQQVSSILNNEGFQSLLKSKPKTTSSSDIIPQQPAATDGYPI